MRRRSLLVAVFALLWERSVPLLWPGLAWLAAFAILSLLGLWDWIGDPSRALYALSTLVAAAWLTWRGLHSFAWPTRDEIARRVEEDSGIEARPHEALADEPVERDPVARSVWSEHRNRMARRLAGAHARRPRAAWARTDVWALRGVFAVLVASAWLIAGPAARDRLGEAFSLTPIIAGGETLGVDAWIDPPAYTGRAPVFLAADEHSAHVPEGSTFVARIAGSRRAPRLTLRGEAGTVRAEPNSIGDGVWEIRAPVDGDATARLAAPGTRQTWTLSIIPDNPPRVRLLSVPEATAAGELDLRFSVTDDYGPTGYALELRPENDSDASWQRLEIDAVGVTPLRGEAEGLGTRLETARHPLAGSRVTIRMVASDAAGNEGVSPPLGVTLPERVFLDALARAVAEQRRGVMSASADYAPLPERPALTAEDIPPGPPYLAEEPQRRIERAPDGLQYTARALDAITDAPQHFFDDPVVYLGIRETVHRLRRSRGQEDLHGLETDLWHIALRAELGSLADAEAALRAAERALMEALARGADETELAALFEAYEAAMENYMAALAREAAEEGRFAEGNSGPSVDTQALQDMLEALREAAELGDTADARQALAALGEMLRNMQMQLAQGGGDGQQSDPVSEAMREALEELGEVIGDQRNLQDQTFGLNQQQPGDGEGSGQPAEPQGGQSGEGPQSLAENQGGGSNTQQLADAQGQLAERFGDSAESLPGQGGRESLDAAREAMREAENALRQGDTDGALAAQERALADLRAGAEELARELLEHMEEGQGQAGSGEDNRDPLGRPAEGAFADGSGVDVPDEMSRARAREILERLRDRAADTGLTQEELDYIERLLDRF